MLQNPFPGGERLVTCKRSHVKCNSMKFLLATKEDMSQLFDENGTVTPVTALQAGPAVVTQVRRADRDGYNSVQVGFGRKKGKNASKPERGHNHEALTALSEDAENTAFRYVREAGKMSPEDVESVHIGEQLDISAFEVGDTITVVGTTKGKGFQGGVKRHGFKGAKERTHGTKHAHREPGAIGATGPQRVFKGKKMAGRMGTNQVTVKNLRVTAIDTENHILYVKGAVPGKKGGLVEVRAAS